METVEADVRRLPFPDGRFDQVLLVSTLEHVGADNERYGLDGAADPGGIHAALRELRRVLAADGSLLVTVPLGEPGDYGWFRQEDVRGWTRHFGRAGFFVEELELYELGKEGWRAAPTFSAEGVRYGDRGPAASAVLCADLSPRRLRRAGHARRPPAHRPAQARPALAAPAAGGLTREGRPVDWARARRHRPAHARPGPRRRVGDVRPRAAARARAGRRARLPRLPALDRAGCGRRAAVDGRPRLPRRLLDARPRARDDAGRGRAGPPAPRARGCRRDALPAHGDAPVGRPARRDHRARPLPRALPGDASRAPRCSGGASPGGGRCAARAG